jgi:hypothetical protein
MAEIVVPDLALAICRAYRLNLRALQAITEPGGGGLLACKIPGLKTMRDLYGCYQRFGKAIWVAADKFAATAMAFSGQANALHLVANLPRADKIRQLSDIGSLLALWYIEEMAYRVTADYNKHKDDPKSAKYEPIWEPVAEEETPHTVTGYDEAFIRKLNALLEA